MHRFTHLSRRGAASSAAWARSVANGALNSSNASTSASASLPQFAASSSSGSSRGAPRRWYAVPVNTKTSVDHLLGVAPPQPPRAASEEVGKGEGAVPNAFVGTARSPNPNDISDLLRGASSSSNSSSTPSRGNRGNGNGGGGGVVTRRPGTALPTEDLDVLFGQQQQQREERDRERQEKEKEEGNEKKNDPLPSSFKRQQQAQQQQQAPNREQPHAIDALYGRNDLDERILAAARAVHADRTSLDVRELLQMHDAQAGVQLSVELPYESRPKEGRRVPVTSAASSDAEAAADAKLDDGVVLIAYVAGLSGQRGQERISVCSGFAVEGGDRLGEGEGKGKGPLIVTCAHTLRASMPSRPAASTEAEAAAEPDASAALAVTRSGHIYPIVSLLSSLPQSDLVLLQLSETPSPSSSAALSQHLQLEPQQEGTYPGIRTLPLNPYPAEVGSELCVSSFWGWEDDSGSTLPAFEYDPSTTTAAPTTTTTTATEASMGGGGTTALRIAPSPLPPPPGREVATVMRERDDAVRSRWGRARLVEYRDGAGHEARPGTYDDLAQMDFKLLVDSYDNAPALQNRLANFPPPGSSGGPIVDVASGSVVGVTRGSRMSQLQGKRGDGVPAERVFFFFALPGLGRK